MAGWTSLGAGARTLVLGGAAAAAAVGAAVVWQANRSPAPTPGPGGAEAVEAAPVPVPAAEPVAKAAPVAEAPPTADAVATALEPPSFDVVRVEPDGATLVAGRAEAGQEVAVLVDGAEVAVTQANPQARFVVFLMLAGSDSPRVMTLELRRSGGPPVPSTDQVLLAPTGAPEAIAAAEPAPEDPPVPAPAGPEADAAEGAGATGGAAAEPPAGMSAAGTDDAAPVAGAVAAAEPSGSQDSPEPAPEVAVAAPPASAAGSAPMPELAPPPVAGAVAAVRSLTPDAPSSAAPDPAGPGPKPALAAADPAPAPPEPVPPAAAAAEPAAPTAILLSGNTARVLQSAGEDSAMPSGAVSIDAISYTAGGDVALSGRGAAQAFVRLYLDNRALLETAVAEDGTWGGTLPAVAPGVYVLRADQVSATGKVTSRFETPFQREDPEALAAPEVPAPAAPAGVAAVAPAPAPGRVSITVQPGFTLWQIARDNYGDGMLYVRVYDANKAQIRDPDLIYPGQVFTVPRGD